MRARERNTTASVPAMTSSAAISSSSIELVMLWVRSLMTTGTPVTT